MSTEEPGIKVIRAPEVKTIHRDFRNAYVVTDECLRGLWQALGRFGKPSGTAECLDGTKLEFTSVDALLREPNPTASRITSMHLSAPGATVVLGEGKDDFTAPIKVVLKASAGTPEDRQLVLEAVDGLKATYRLMTRFNAGFVFSGTLLFMVFARAVSVPKRPDPPPVSFGLALVAIIGVLGSALALFLLGKPIRRWQKTLFPMATFAVGQQKRAHQTRGYLRGLFVSTGISIFLFIFWRLAWPT